MGKRNRKGVDGRGKEDAGGWGVDLLCNGLAGEGNEIGGDTTEVMGAGAGVRKGVEVCVEMMKCGKGGG